MRQGVPLLLALLVLALGQSFASAQGGTDLDSIDRSFRRAPAEATAGGVDPPALTPAALDVRWELLRSADAGTEEEARAFDALASTMDELGITALPAHSVVLLQRADDALSSGDLERARTLRAWAERIDPGSAQPWFFDARMVWETEPWSVIRVGTSIVRAYQRFDLTLPGKIAIGKQWRTFAYLVTLIFALPFGLLLAVRHGGLFAHDLRLMSFRSLTIPHGRALVALMLIAPALMMWSPLAFVLAALLIAAGYMSVVERVLSLLLLGALAAMPILMHDYAQLVAANELGGARVIAAIDSPCDGRCMAQLDERLLRDNDAHAALAQAWVLFRSGVGVQHERALVMISEREFSAPAESSAQVLRGSIAFVAGRTDEAEQHFRAALETALTNRQRAVAHFNLYRVFMERGDTPNAQEALRDALIADEATVAPRAEYRGRSQNLLLLSSPLPADLFFEEIRNAPADAVVEAATGELLAPWVGAIPPLYIWPAIFFVAVAVVIGFLVERQGLSSCRCDKCATPTSRYIYAEAFRSQLCILCYQLKHALRHLTPQQRIAREARVDRWQALAPRLVVFTNVFVPGAGFLGGGRTLLGSLLLLLCALGAGSVLLDTTPLAVPWSLGTERVFDGRIPAGVGFLLSSYLASAGLGYALTREK